MSIEVPPAAEPPVKAPSSLLFTVLAIATGALVANLYYAQPLIALIGPELSIEPAIAGLLVSVTQIGYGIGLFLIVSLADIIENKRLVLITLTITTAALVAIASSTSAALFFMAAFTIGLCSTGAQVLVPYAARLVPEAQRGRTVGNVMAGLLTGILLARPLSLFVSSAFGWRPVFWMSAVVMLIIGGLLVAIMPKYQPAGGRTYGRNLASMWGIFTKTPILRRRSGYQFLVFATFSMLWTAAPLMLLERFALSQTGIAFFALAGAGGALAAPIAGRFADRGYGQASTALAIGVVALGFLASIWAVSAGALIALVILAVLIDAAVQFNQIVSQRMLFVLPADIRGRVNALYMTSAFFGGACGSILATATYHWGGWTATAGAAATLAAVAFAYFLTEFSGKTGAGGGT